MPKRGKGRNVCDTEVELSTRYHTSSVAGRIPSCLQDLPPSGPQPGNDGMHSHDEVTLYDTVDFKKGRVYSVGLT